MDFLQCPVCQKKFPSDPFSTFCLECHEPLLFPISKDKKTIHFEKSNSLEKFLDFLPLPRIEPRLCLGTGNTPLVPLFRLNEEFGLPQVYAKNETVNPTGSFKDRGTAVAIQFAVQAGIRQVGTVSTGNMASSTAAFGARAGLQTFVLVKEDTPIEKILSTSIYNPQLIKVSGDYGHLFFKSLELGRKHNIYFMNSVDPYRIEGYKILGFEIYIECNLQSPDYIFVPVSAGGHILGLMKAFKELKENALVENTPTFFGVQAEGCSPIVQAYVSQKSKVERIAKAETIAQAISNPDPPGGNIVLKWIRETGGQVISVTDREILSAQKLLAEKEGLFCLPASATTLAGLLRLSKKNIFSPKDKIVLVLTGTGLKSLKTLESPPSNIHHSSLDDLDNTLASLMT